MDRLQSMKVFRTVAELGGFSAAARQLDLSNPVVTRLVADLEKHLGVRLLNRSTRSLSLTDAGAVYLERCRRVLDEIDDMDALVFDQSRQLHGELRIASPVSFGISLLTPLLKQYREKYPKITVELTLVNGRIDMLSDRFELAVMLDLAGIDENLISRPLLNTPSILCASPRYLVARGLPRTPEDLERHDCLNFSHPLARQGWDLIDSSGTAIRAKINNVFVSNTLHALICGAQQGMGICAASACLVADEIRAGSLVRVLPQFSLQSFNYALVYPSRKYLPMKVRTMIDFLQEQLGKSAPATTG
ncbi:MAG TPA: LysR family transcriptional regulator [Noviherbaspirillum sp.]|nr:LysR family transcriptional regulator [Noviherbaspirillum sp.]